MVIGRKRANQNKVTLKEKEVVQIGKSKVYK